jgi:DNA-binding transcriptional regulator YhcF (GntR family)
MEFEENRPIYLQIADYMFENIVSGAWEADERVPSIRELAMDMEVNPNTVVRTFAHLQDLGIIYNKRGIGYFVASDGPDKVLQERKTLFFQEELPRLFRMMETLGIEIGEITGRYETFNKER